MEYIITESPVIGKARNVKKLGDTIRMECVLQTSDVLNRNKRLYSKAVINEGVQKVKERIREGSLLGELDHPIDNNPVRQITVLYKEASHKFVETGWDGNKLVGILETLATPNGEILRNLVSVNHVPVGYSFRGMGDIRTIMREGQQCHEVVGPLQTVTWDAVSYPSHPGANLIRVTEQVSNTLQEACGIVIENKKGYNNLLESLSVSAIRNGYVQTKNNFLVEENAYEEMLEYYRQKVRIRFGN